MVGALFLVQGGRVSLHHGGSDCPSDWLPVKVKLFKHMHESLKCDRFDTKLLTGKYQLVLN